MRSMCPNYGTSFSPNDPPAEDVRDGEADEVAAYTNIVESTRTANDRFGEEDMDEWLEYAVDDEETE